MRFPDRCGSEAPVDRIKTNRAASRSMAELGYRGPKPKAANPALAKIQIAHTPKTSVPDLLGLNFLESEIELKPITSKIRYQIVKTSNDAAKELSIADVPEGRTT